MGQTVAFRGQPLHLCGELPKLGEPAPDFTVVTRDFQPLRLSDLRGRTVLLSVTPSLDTPVCQQQCLRFDKEAAALDSRVRVLNLSMDLPFAIQRCWTDLALGQIIAATDFRGQEFARGWGLLLEELGLLARSVWVVDRQGSLVYGEVVADLGSEPDYDAALSAVQAAL